MPDPTPTSSTLKVQVTSLTLGQVAALKGYERQHQLLQAIKDRGLEVPQPTLSGMYRGDVGYPKARAAVAAVLELSEDELGAVLRNSRPAA